MGKLHIQSAVGQNGGGCRPNLTHHVLASAKIGQIIPIFHQECVPGDSYKVHSSMFSRFEPLAVPSYVNLTYRTMSVFVPYHQIMNGTDSYFANQAKNRGYANRIPYFTLYHFRLFLEQTAIATFVTTAPASYDYRATMNDGATSYRYYTLTPLGNYAIKVLHLLGFRAPKNIPYVTTTNLGQRYNFLPVLAFFHAYNCYMSYAPFYNESTLSSTLEKYFRQEDPVISGTDLRVMFSQLLLTYEDSFYTSLWNQPFGNSPIYAYNTFKTTTGLDQVANINDGDSPTSVADNNSIAYDTEKGVSITNSQVGFENLTASQVRLLLKFDDYFRRSNFAGNKEIEKIYSQFGVKIDDYRTRYPYFLGESSRNVQVGDVTSTADTEGAPIGAYAGKAIGNGDADFSFRASDYGILITFAWFAPKPLYINGIDKEYLRLEPFDFYTPNLDSNLAAAVQQQQYNVDSVAPSAVFGYAPLYSEYLMHNDYVVGNFERFIDYRAWHFGRYIANDRSGAPLQAQDDLIIYMPNTGTEFERIFHITDTSLVDVDTINMTIENSMESFRPMNDMTGKTGLSHGDVQVDMNGNNIN